MIKRRGMTRDASVKVIRSRLMDFSAATANQIFHYDPERDWVAQRVDVVVEEVCDTAQKIINLGTAADPDSILDGLTSVVTAAAAGSVVNLTTEPIVFVAGTVYTCGHEQASGTGTGILMAQICPRDDNPTERGEM